MTYELGIQDNETGKIYDITNIAEPITIKKSIDGSAGQLTCILQKDPTNDITIRNGSAIWFKADNVGIFFGYIFKIGTDAEENYKITAYDQLRYLKNSDVYTFRTETASQIFEKICKDWDLKYKVVTPITYQPPAYSYVDKSLYSIIERGLQLASINDKKLYYLIDDYGTLKLSEFGYEGEKLSIQLGDASMVTSFTYERSIDSNTYNKIKLYRDNPTSGKIDTWSVYDGPNVQKWGILQLFKKVDDTLNASQIREQADNYLKVYNKESETLKIQAEGIIECIAGKRLRFVLEREKIDRWMWIISSTHTFTHDTYTMDLEVAV